MLPHHYTCKPLVPLPAPLPKVSFRFSFCTLQSYASLMYFSFVFVVKENMFMPFLFEKE